VLLFVTAVIAGVGGRRLVLLAAAGAIALLRWDSVMMTVPTLVIAAIIDRPRPRHALLATSVFGVQNGYSGPKVTWFEYFTQVLTPEETVRRTVNAATTPPDSQAPRPDAHGVPGRNPALSASQ
jgi:hypothetical protein